MNDTKVVRFDPDSTAYGYFLGMRKAEYGDYVTHADYMALEERYELVCKFADRTPKEQTK